MSERWNLAAALKQANPRLGHDELATDDTPVLSEASFALGEADPRSGSFLR